MFIALKVNLFWINKHTEISNGLEGFCRDTLVTCGADDTDRCGTLSFCVNELNN
ncbi:unnamed protein product, partial [Rotaria sordida]